MSGNFHSTYANSGAYDPVADILFGEENVNAYYLEFDDERSGGFAPLAKVSGDKKVVLGLITTKSPKLENKEEVIARIKEAANYIPLDRLYLSPQCGFASCEIGKCGRAIIKNVTGHSYGLVEKPRSNQKNRRGNSPPFLYHIFRNKGIK